MKNTIILMAAAGLLFVSCSSVQKKVDVLEVSSAEKVVRAEAQKQTEVKPPVDENTYYTVKGGDTLWLISKRVCGKGSLWKKLAVLNGYDEKTLLRPGTRIKTTGICVPDSVKGAIAAEVIKPFVYRVVENKAYGVGEKLEFEVKYFGVTAGIATLEVKGIEKYNDRQVYHIDATARTAPFFETFYRVKDVISTYMDVMGLFSWKYSKKLEEGGYRNTTVMEFDHEKGTAVKNNGDKCEIKPFIQDVLSEFYYFRNVFTGQDEVKIDVASDECKSYQIVIKKLRYEKVTIDAGEFDCVVVQPFLKYEGIFRQKGDIWIWLTNDKNLMPVMIKSQIAIGTIDVVLQRASVVKAE